MLSLIIVDCSKDNLVSNIQILESKGNISINLNKESAPADVTGVVAFLSREGFNTIYKNLDLTSDSTAAISFDSIKIGIWHLKVNAFK